MSDSGGALVGGLIGLGAILFIIYWIVIIVAVIAGGAVVLSMIALGVFSFFMAKSGKALVNQRKATVALLSAIEWSGTLCVGCVIGSVGLLTAISVLTGGGYAQAVFEEHMFGFDPLSRWTSFFLNWVGYSAISFFISVALVLYLANRIYIARMLGGPHWLGVIPPLAASVIFFVSKHFESIIAMVRARDFHLLADFALMLLNDIIFPFKFVFFGLQDPEKAWRWAWEALKASDGSFFTLGSLLPSVFVVMATVILSRNVFVGGGSADPAL